MPKILIPEDFLCPITQELMIDPVATADGQIYERKAIEEWLKNHDTSPLTNVKLKNKDLISIPFVKKQIQSFFEQAKICTEKEFFAAIAMRDINKINQLNFLESHLEAKTEQGDTPLHCATQSGSAELVAWLLNAEANVNVTGYLNRSPLHDAAAFGNVQIVKLLLNAGAYVNVKAFEDQRTPLHAASFSGHAEIVTLLLAAPNASVDIGTDTNYTSLNMAIDQNHPAVVKLLLDAKANPNFRHKCKGDLKPLHCAALDGKTEIVKMLIMAGADLKAKTDIGNTPLHCAAMNNQIETFQLLLDLKADLEVKNFAGYKPLDQAKLYCYIKIIGLIEAHQEKSVAKLKLQQAIEFNSQCVKGFKQGKYEEAIKNGLKALQIFFGSNAEPNQLAMCYYNLGASYLALYEKTKPIFGLIPLEENKNLISAITNLQGALSFYNTLNNAEFIKKTIDKINVCFKYKLWHKLTYIQRAVFDDLNLQPIHIAVIFNDFSLVKNLYALDAQCLEQFDNNGWPPLVYGLFFKASLDLVKFLIEKNTPYLTRKYSPMAFSDMHNFRLENDIKYFNKASGINVVADATLELLYADRDSGYSLDSDVEFPPIFYALIHLEIVKNLRGSWNNDTLMVIVRLLVSLAPQQLECFTNSKENDDSILKQALACKLPKEIIIFLIEKTPQTTFLKTGDEVLDIALQKSISEDVIKTLITLIPDHLLEEQPILVNALRKKYSEEIINMLISKNSNCIKVADWDVPPLFAAIVHKAPLNVIKLVLNHDTTAALQLTGATLLNYWDDEDSDDEEWVRGHKVTALILALIFNRPDIANYLLERLPQLIDIKDENNRLPISYVKWDTTPLAMVKKILVLSLTSLYQEENCKTILSNLLSSRRVEVTSLCLQLGFGMGIDMQNFPVQFDAANCVVIGMSVNGKAITRKTRGFAQSITNLKEFYLAQQQGKILKTTEELEHFIKLIRLIITSKKHLALQTVDSHLTSIEQVKIDLLIKFEKWLLANQSSNTFTTLKIDDLTDKLSFKILRFLPTKEIGKLATLSHKWQQLTQDENEWQKRIHRELTKIPQLLPGQTYKGFYQRIYQGIISKDNATFVTRSPYHRYLSEIQNVSPLSTSSMSEFLKTACRIGAEVWAADLLQRGAKIDWYAFTHALDRGNDKLLDLLITHGADLTIRDINSPFHHPDYHKDKSLLHYAAYSDHSKKNLHRLFQENNKITVLPELHKAAAMGDLKKLIELLYQGANVNALDVGNSTALWWALVSEQENCVRILLSKNASLHNISGGIYSSALMTAVWRKHLGCLQAVVEKGVDLHETIKERYQPVPLTALHIAIKCNFLDGMNYLIQKGIKINDDNDKTSFSPLQLAAKLGRTDCLVSLLKKGATVNRAGLWIQLDEDGKDDTYTVSTPLFLAVEYGHLNCVKVLLRAGANPDIDQGYWWIQNKRSGEKITTDSKYPILNMFMKHINSYHWIGQLSTQLNNELSQTEFDPNYAPDSISYAYIDCLRLLLQNGANPNKSNDQAHSTLLQLFLAFKDEKRSAAQDNFVEACLKLLLRFNADVTQQEKYTNKNALHYAAQQGMLGSVMLLVEKKKACISQPDKDGNTPLLLAARQGHLDIIEYLLENGASLDETNLAGETVLSLAMNFNQHEVVNFIESQNIKASQHTSDDVASTSTTATVFLSYSHKR